MPIKKTFLARVTGGALQFADGEAWRAFREGLADSDYLVTVESFYPKRTLPQNSYLHVIFTIIGKYTGNDLEEVKEALKREFALVDHINVFTGEIEQVPQNTSKMDTYELSQFIEKVKKWALDFLGLEIPDAGDKVSIDNLLGK